MRYIATFGYHANHIFDDSSNFVGTKERISDVILIYSVDEDAKNYELQQIEKTKEELESKLKFLEVPHIIIKVDPYDFNENVKRFRSYIIPKTIINITGGKRIVGHALFYSAILERNKIEKVIYVSKIGKIIELPLISPEIKLTTFEKQILKILDKRKYMYVSEIARELGKSISMVSEYISKLEKKGLVRKIHEGRKRRIERVI